MFSFFLKCTTLIILHASVCLYPDRINGERLLLIMHCARRLTAKTHFLRRTNRLVYFHSGTRARIHNTLSAEAAGAERSRVGTLRAHLMPRRALLILILITRPLSTHAAEYMFARTYIGRAHRESHSWKLAPCAVFVCAPPSAYPLVPRRSTESAPASRTHQFSTQHCFLITELGWEFFDDLV